MKKYSGFSAKTFLLIASLTVLASCNDTWKDHYSYKTDNNYPVDKIDVTLEAIEGYENFYTALETTDLYDKDGNRYKENQTFLDLLHQDQFITVWAPSNESISDTLWSIYMNPNKSDSLNYEVGEKFLKMHIARFKHSTGNVDTTKVFMLNGKPIESLPTTMGGISYHGNDKNIRCLNGILHCLDRTEGSSITYLPNIYEFITTDPGYRELLGDWYKSYTREEVDQEKSYASGIDENGEMIWVDAVMIESSILMKDFGYINSEDSTYAFLLPNRDIWTAEFNRIKDYFVYNESKLNNDSLQKFYTYCAMMTDMYFNMNEKLQKHYPDSVFSTFYDFTGNENRREKKPYHVFSYPEDKVNGIFGSAEKEIECSNGKIYIVNKWPFVDTLTFLRDIKLEAENYKRLSSLFDVTQRTVTSIGGEELENSVRVMKLAAADGANLWNSGAKFYITDNLRGKYDVKLVLVPNLDDDNKAASIHPVIHYNDDILFDSTVQRWDYDYDEYGNKIDSDFVVKKFTVENKRTGIDTVYIKTIDIPYSAYDMNSSPLAVELISIVNANMVKDYSGEIWLDGIILEPVYE